MKKVIFVCLLTLSVCLSQPAGEQAAPVSKASAAGVAQTPAGGANQALAGGTNQAPVDNVTQAPGASSTTTVDPKVQTQKPTELTKTTESALPADHKDPAIPVVSTKSTTANESASAPTTTPKPGVTTSAPNAITTTTHKPTTPKAAATTVPTLARGFDGASFVGGIILTLGLIAIGFMGFKYYKAQTERNYHTL